MHRDALDIPAEIPCILLIRRIEIFELALIRDANFFLLLQTPLASFPPYAHYGAKESYTGSSLT